jgi:hypothetical protein
MIEIKNMTDEKLKRWIEIYESIPMVRILIPSHKYKEASIEAYSRFKDNYIDKYFYFVYINSQGTTEDYNQYCKNE